MKRRAWSFCSRLLSYVLVFTLLFSLSNPITTEAKGKKITLVPKLYSNEIADIEEGGIASISKAGNYTIVIPKNETGNFNGYLKFVVPKTKNYSFTASKVKGKKKDFIFGTLETLTADSNGSTNLNCFKIKKKKNAFLDVATKKYSNHDKSRTGTVKLTKGSTVYIWFEFHQGKKSSQCSLNLKIK